MLLPQSEAVHYGTEIDIWSAGIVFTEIILGFTFTEYYQGEDLFKRLATVFDLSYYKSPLTKNIVPRGLSQYILSKLNTQNVDDLEPLFELLKRMMDVNPDTRISAEKALQHDYFSSFTSSTDRIFVSRPKFLEPNTYDWTLKHPELTKMIRDILLKWLCEVTITLKCNVETYSQCIEIIDAFMTKTTNKIEKKQFQLVGVAALFISSSMNEFNYIDLFDWFCDNKHEEEQLNEMTWNIFDCLKHLMPRTRLTKEVIKRNSLVDLKLICEKYCSSFPDSPM